MTTSNFKGLTIHPTTLAIEECDWEVKTQKYLPYGAITNYKVVFPGGLVRTRTFINLEPNI